MALRDQPYLPLYVQDFLTDEKLMECSASATGIYIRLLCIMHKSEDYGVILLKQKDKQTDNQIKNFALKLAKYLPYSTDEIMTGLSELISEGVLQNGGDKLSQKRMIKDNTISLVRADAGKKGGLKTQFAKAKEEAKLQANTENENENENEIDYGFVVENYHSLCPKLNKVAVVNDLRKGFINARVTEFGMDKVITVLRMAGESEFLNGKNDKAWKADFEWIMRPQNFIKVMEEKYKTMKIQASDPKMSTKYLRNDIR
jgi:uncharacterized protein YdaU (DUF1376 family)